MAESIFGELEPDDDDQSNFLSNLSTCNCLYLEENKLNDFFDFGHGPKLNIMHVNCRSINKNYKSLVNLLHRISEPLTAIGVTETWLNSNYDASFDIKGYKFVTTSRVNRSGGGVGLYINSCYDFHVCKDLSLMQDHLESIFVEIKQQGVSNIIIGCIYRPPNTDVTLFNSDLSNILNVLGSRYKGSIFLLGDFNLDLIRSASHAPTGEFFSSMMAHAFLPTKYIIRRELRRALLR